MNSGLLMTASTIPVTTMRAGGLSIRARARVPGSRDVYYDKTKTDFHREEYSKLNFSIEKSLQTAKDKLIEIHRLEPHLSHGWLFVAKISDTKVVVRRSH
jgi:hypothetical protein